MDRHVSSTVGNYGLKIIRCLGLDYLNTLGYFRSKQLKNAKGSLSNFIGASRIHDSIAQIRSSIKLECFSLVELMKDFGKR